MHDKFILQAEPYEDEDQEMTEAPEAEDPEDDMDDDDGATDSDSDSGSDDPIPNIPDNATILANKKTHPLFARLFRSKGEIFLSTRPNRAGEWSQAGAMLTIRGGRPWFCTIPEEEYLTGSEEIDALVKHDIAQGGEWGDRRQEVVFIGEDLDVPGLERVLDECLLNDEEWEFWVATMRGGDTLEEKMAVLQDRFDDGFPDWDENEGVHEHGHGHEHSTQQVGQISTVHAPQTNGHHGRGVKASRTITKAGIVAASA